MLEKIHKDSILPDEQIDFYTRRDSPNLYSALNKCADDLEKKGYLITEGWRVSDLLREAALNLKPEEFKFQKLAICVSCGRTIDVDKGCQCRKDDIGLT